MPERHRAFLFFQSWNMSSFFPCCVFCPLAEGSPTKSSGIEMLNQVQHDDKERLTNIPRRSLHCGVMTLYLRIPLLWRDTLTIAGKGVVFSFPAVSQRLGAARCPRLYSSTASPSQRMTLGRKEKEKPEHLCPGPKINSKFKSYYAAPPAILALIFPSISVANSGLSASKVFTASLPCPSLFPS